MGIPLFPCLIYATDGSQEGENMGAFADMKAKREGSARQEEMRRVHPPTERNTPRHASLSKTQ